MNSDLERLSDEARARKSKMPEWLAEFVDPAERRPSIIEQLAGKACPRCAGTGKTSDCGGMFRAPEADTCPDCDGTGRFSHPGELGYPCERCGNDAETDAEMKEKRR